MLGNYYLQLRFGDTVIPISTSVLRELTIVQDYNKFLPEIRLRLDDASGILTHLAPFDKSMTTVYVEFAQDQSTDDKNGMTFTAYMKEPKGTQSTPAAEYDITGLLNINGLFAPDQTRGFSGSIKTSIESVASELSVDSTDVSSSLDYSKNLIQPQWNNAQFLKYLKENLIGKAEEYGFKCFITSETLKTKFVFKSLLEMIRNPISYKFMLYDQPYEDYNPILEYYPYDNYKLYGAFGTREQDYSYFNYTTGELVSSSENATNYLSLSDYYLIDQNDTTDNNTINETGRSNDFTSNFHGPVKSSYGNRLIGLSKMWITSKGLPNIQPGQTVQTFFPQGAMGGNLYSYGYSGFWAIERVVHNMGDVFLTKLLLTRQGTDTDKNTTLVRATSKKKS